MNMFARLKVGTTLIAGFLCLSVIGAIVSAIGIYNMSRINDMADRMYDQELLGLSYIKEANINLIYIGRARGNALLATNEQERQNNLTEVKKSFAGVKENLEKARPLFVAPRAKEIYSQYEQISTEYEQELNRAFKLLEKEKFAERSEELSKTLVDARKKANTLDDMLTELSKLKEARAKDASDETTRIYETSRTFMILLTICSVLAGMALGVLITRGLTRQLGGEPGEASEIAGKIAAGDLNVSIPLRAGDTASMLHAMKQMRDSLANIVGQVRSGTETIATASAEVAAGSQDLSARTEQQASSLEETASSMEELTSTVKQNAENARQANVLAATASSVASKGGEVIGQVVGTMEEINTSASKIVDIIGVIDGIAFQTNILALNAAVEAARAGEQGRGFAVVASEVRTLAQRSANAAKEIKSLIGDSVEKVEAGSSLVNQAGATMVEIVESVKRVTDIMAEITAASAEQTAGIEQINQAVTEMDTVTQQNAALVEEAAAASEAMQEQAANLAQVVSVFKLDSHADAIVGSPRAEIKSMPAKRPVRPSTGTSKRISNGAATRMEVVPRQALASARGSDWEEF